MKLFSACFQEQGKIPPENAFCIPDPASRCALGRNRNPDLSWSGLPAGARSLVLICHDPDVPSRGDDVNKEGRIVPAGLARVDFFHWVLVDLPADAKFIGKGEFSENVTARGKPGPEGARGVRQGINDYSGWFASDRDMAGDYFGYDGPCPPWNDERVHHYVFTLFAIDLEKCPVTGKFSGQDARRAIAGHVLGQASLTGRYTLNPMVKL